jgi:hypothetical protein
MIGPVRFFLAAGIAAAAFANLWQVNQTLRWVKPREDDAVVVLESRLRFIRNALMKEGYWRGDVGYMPAGILQGHSRTSVDDEQWALVRYAMIPWNILQDSLHAPYVLIDGTKSGTPIEVPPGFVPIYDSADGLVLVKNKPIP